MKQGRNTFVIEEMMDELS